jgi:predicted acylesterase/phospholipase RssA/CRP-like cAMP-binding protein
VSDPLLVEKLEKVSQLQTIRAEGRAALAEHAELSELAADASVPPPEEGGCIGLLGGRVAVVSPEDDRAIAVLDAGVILAALSILGRDVMLRALEPCEVVRVAAAGIEALVGVDPEGVAALAQEVARTEQALQVAVHLARLFPGLDHEALAEFGDGVEWQTLQGGEWLFREGDAADAAYLVISGRLRAVSDSEAGDTWQNEVGSGETVGEMALLTDDLRSAGVYAVRDSQLARLSRSAFDALTMRHPQALRRIAGFVVDRLRRHTSGATAHTPQKTFAVVASGPGVDLAGFCRVLVSSLARLETVDHVDRQRVDAALGRRGIADVGDGDAAEIRLIQWLNERDSRSRYVLYEADRDWTPWTERALRQADHVLVVANAEDAPAPGAVESRFAKLWDRTRAPQQSLVLLREPGREPRGTAHWLAARDVDRHFHAVRDREPDFARLARLLAGRGLGVVLGGGGARGFAHLGVLRALEEAGVSIDLIGGTSIGSIIGALPAMGRSAAESLDQCREHISSLFDPTLPMVSILTGRRIGARLQTVMGEVDIEDLPIPFFCVATNLSRAEEVVQSRGSLFRAVRSSISLPGILPPISEGGDLYVDGGLLNNLPIDVMRGWSGDGPIVAVDVSPEEDLRSMTRLESELSGWTVLWRRLNPFASSIDAPYISNVLMRSAVVASVVKERARESAEDASLYLKLPIEEWSLLEFEKLEAIAARGYEASREPVREWAVRGA